MQHMGSNTGEIGEMLTCYKEFFYFFNPQILRTVQGPVSAVYVISVRPFVCSLTVRI